MTKRFTIDVETENYENAYFENDKFLCYEDDYDAILNRLNELNEENEQLKEEIAKFKEWEKHIRDIKREDLDIVFKMSIYEIAEAFEYYRRRIKELEE